MTKNVPLIFIDFESTGLDIEKERITQIAAIKIVDGKEEEFITYVNPEKEISEFITNLTGISNDTVKDSPTEKEAIFMLNKFIEKDAVIIAQNASYDLGMLHYANLRSGNAPLTLDFCCTWVMSSVMFPNLSHKLEDIVKLFDIKLDEAHNAINDVRATKELFYKLKHVADFHNINFINKLVEKNDRPLKFKPDNAQMIIHKK